MFTVVLGSILMLMVKHIDREVKLRETLYMCALNKKYNLNYLNKQVLKMSAIFS